MANKFKPGDKIVPNKNADELYRHTHTVGGWRGTVIGYLVLVRGDDDEMYYEVADSAFDLVEDGKEVE